MPLTAKSRNTFRHQTNFTARQGAIRLMNSGGSSDRSLVVFSGADPRAGDTIVRVRMAAVDLRHPFLFTHCVISKARGL